LAILFAVTTEVTMLKKANGITEARSGTYPWVVAAILLLASIIVGSNGSDSFGANAEKSFHQLMHKAMSLMDQGMENAAMTSDPDHDFAAMMIPHHQGAVDMAKLELLYGKDSVLRRLAQEIIVTQEQEIAVMQMRLNHFKTP
jgi:Domain of unknown function (DUF305)